MLQFNNEFLNVIHMYTLTPYTQSSYLTFSRFPSLIYNDLEENYVVAFLNTRMKKKTFRVTQIYKILKVANFENAVCAVICK